MRRLIASRVLSAVSCVVFAGFFIWPSATAVAERAAQRPAAEITFEGIVNDSAGRPVAGAAVALVTDASIPMMLTGGELRPADEDVAAITSMTDARGRFELAGIDGQMLRDEAFMIVATHPEGGYGEARADAGAGIALDLRLAPWARFKGTGKLGGVPAGGMRMRLAQSPLTDPQLWVEEEAAADDQGRFVLERCRPGFTIIEQRARQDGDWGRADVAVLHRGKTTRWTGELQRRPIRGRLVVPKRTTLAVHVQAFLRRIPDQPEPRLPDEALGLFGAERKAWVARWIETTDEGRAYEAEQVRFNNQATDVNLTVDRDGKVSFNRVEVGAPAPDLVLRRLMVQGEKDGVVAVDGKAGDTIRVSDYRGRYLLLDCWATWCGPCLAATPRLKALHAAWPGQLAIVGVTFDEDPAAAARYVRKAALPWEQAIASGQADEGAVDAIELGGLFGGGLPNFILIDPRGRLASTGHDLSVVEKILEGEPGGRGDKGTRGQGDKGTRGQGGKGTRR